MNKKRENGGFEKGDIVRLKTGGPKMLVVGFECDSIVCRIVSGEKRGAACGPSPDKLALVRKGDDMSKFLAWLEDDEDD